MRVNMSLLRVVFFLVLVSSCAIKKINIAKENLKIVNREIIPNENSDQHELSLNAVKGDGLAVFESISFETGTIELEIRGEDVQGKSFVGLAFNIQNDSTYEAVYFRPFNFKNKDVERRFHSMQYISHPKNTWKYLRTNFEGQFEATFNCPPAPDDWFSVVIKIEADKVYVYDKRNNTELMQVKRLEKQSSNKIGFWTGFNSKGDFKNLVIKN